MPDWVRELMRVVREVIPREFVGQLEINLFKGGISNVTVRQSYKEDTAIAGEPRG